MPAPDRRVCRSDAQAKASRARASHSPRAVPPLRARGPSSSRFRMVFGRSWTHLSGQVAVVHRSRSSCRERRPPRPQAFDPAEDLGEQGARHRYLGQLGTPRGGRDVYVTKRDRCGSAQRRVGATGRRDFARKARPKPCLAGEFRRQRAARRWRPIRL